MFSAGWLQFTDWHGGQLRHQLRHQRDDGGPLSMIISLFNSVSRVFYGIIYDKITENDGDRHDAVYHRGHHSLLRLWSGSTALLAVSHFCRPQLRRGADDFFRLHPDHRKKYYPSTSIQGTYMFSPFLGTMLFSALFTATQSYPLSYSYLIAYALIALGLFFGLNRLLNNPKTTAR
ncbi:MAG: hypothetical protein ACLSA6_18095 [Holdemania massiliensis]